MRHAAYMRTRVVLVLGVIAVAGTACGDDDPGGPGTGRPGGAVVLNGVGDPGVTVVPETGTGIRVPFGSEFDGTVMRVRGDSVLSTSSSFGGDQLFIADVAAGTLRKVQLPPNSNPAGATFAPLPPTAALAAHRWAVTLRNTGQLALVTMPLGEAPTVSLLGDAGRCPYDVLARGDELWSVDANLECASTYAVAGPGRLIRVPLAGASRDTVPLGPAVVNPLRAVAIGDLAYVFAGGCSPFSDGCALTPAAIARVDLSRRQVTKVLSFPAQSYGVSMSLGADGILYATAASTLFGSGFDPRVYAVDPATLEFVGPFASGRSYRALARTGGTYPVCFAASADRDGRIHCIENGDVAATLLVFDRAGAPVRAAPAGSLAFDLAVR